MRRVSPGKQTLSVPTTHATCASAAWCEPTHGQTSQYNLTSTEPYNKPNKINFGGKYNVGDLTNKTLLSFTNYLIRN